jgi:hypothetical protein
VIQLVSVSGKSGVFVLNRRGEEGTIYLENGHIVHAVLGRLLGEEAVYTLATWNEGSFHFQPGEEAPTRTITKNNTNLLMEAARRLDEWRVLSKKIPSVDLVPEFVILENREGQINLNTMEWLLLSKIDGQRSVRQIAGAAGMGVFDAAKLLYGLVATNLIRLKEKGAANAASAPVAVASASNRPAAPPAAGQPVATPPPPPPALTRLARLRDECVALLGPVGETVVQKHYLRARGEIERGAGPEAIEEALQQIARAAGILKGSAVAEAVLRLLKS